MEIPQMFQWEIKKGMGLLATGDWTHPKWIAELKKNLDEDGSGILKIKEEIKKNIILPKNYNEPKFFLSTEVSLVYTQGGKGRRVHLLLWVPDFETADKINQKLTSMKMNISSDGRPIMKISARDFTELALNINPKNLIIPAHIWTPWFAIFGSMSGFDSIKDCFLDMAPEIHGVETGLSSDPVMNWRIKELDSRAILSFSDAHSGPKLGREATTFDLEELSFNNLRQAIVEPNKKNKITYTIEFYPEEGKYHYTGHRSCNISQTPEETKKNGVLCPVCHRPLTVGVMHRIENLTSRSEKELELVNWQLDPNSEIKGIKSKSLNKPPYVKIVPLPEIIAETANHPVGSKKTIEEYEKLVSHFNGEFNILLHSKISNIAKISGEKIAEGILKMRTGDITIIPGFDGNFGVVTIGKPKKNNKKLKIKKITNKSKNPQMELF
jgi:uncharacterized protein (TIGR00375 family)